MAGLALLFSMAIELQPEPPHMILLDEVDAHLDADNAKLLALFISDWQNGKLKLVNSSARSQKVPQILMISHKNEMLSKTNSLIGVTSTVYDRQTQASDDEKENVGLNFGAKPVNNKFVSAVTFSLDLEKYQDE